MSPRPQKRMSISDLKERIMAAAWDQIAREGAPALSLRAIARELKIAAPSIYHYFPDRDALVTALIVAAFTSFGDMQEKSLEGLLPDDHSIRLRALGMAYRKWAITYPERYHLIFGTPIAGYRASMEITTPSASRSLFILADVLARAQDAGKLRNDVVFVFSPKTREMLHAWQAECAPSIPIEVLFMALTIWARVHGLVSLEIGHQFPPYITDAAEIFCRDLENIILQTIQ